MRPIAIFRFSPTEGPAYFAEWLDAHGFAWELIALDAGAAVPANPRAFSGIGMMGGPMSAYDALPWIAPLGALLRAAVDAKIPVIGHCLGGQLFAQALGAPVTRTAAPEIGWIDVNVFNANQAFVVDERHIGFQCHIEMTLEMTETWVESGAKELPARSIPRLQSASDIRR